MTQRHTPRLPNQIPHFYLDVKTDVPISLIHLDTTPERHDELVKQKFVQGVKIGREEAVMALREIWLLSDCPCGADLQGFAEWLDRICRL